MTRFTRLVFLVLFVPFVLTAQIAGAGAIQGLVTDASGAVIPSATVTAANVDYEGSLTVSVDLMEAVGLLPYERILCSNLSEGQRFETYAIPGERGTGAIILNGATAHLGKAGDLLTIMSFTFIEEAGAQKWEPRVIVLGARNAIINHRGI